MFHALPIDTSFYIRQIDNRFGTVVYRATLQAQGQQVIFWVSNVIPLKKFGLQLAEIGDGILFIAIQKRGDYLDFTAWQWLRFTSGLPAFLAPEKSFAHRLRAVAGFYLNALAEK